MNKVILLTGPPGAGKGTQAEIISEKHGWYSFSIGQLLRDTASPDIKQKMDRGELLPKEYVVGLVVDEIRKQLKPAIVDGFPRSLEQALEFDRIMDSSNGHSYQVVFIDVDQEESWRRVSTRGRTDDERKAWENRWSEYHIKTVPAINHYRQNGSLIEIDGNGSIDSVYASLIEIIAL